MTATSLCWRKSSFSGQNGTCVELADADRSIGVRNSNHPDAGTLWVSRAAIAGLLATARDDDL
jgi:hypothetical protein